MVCLNCQGELKEGKFYCSVSCNQQYRKKQYIERWLAGNEDGMRGEDSLSTIIREYMLIESQYKCSKCGWNEVNPHTNKVPLEIDHIDGDWRNNAKTNLQVLCPNCHALTATYKGANKGGRDRRKYKSRY
jgi:hypothetical protein